MNSPQSTHASTAAASHTPGPWKAIKRGVGTDWIVIPADHEKRPDNWILAECRYQSNDEANARLIAAAPELLSALIEMVGHAEAVTDMLPLPRRFCASLHDAKAAITKASK